MNPQFRPKEEFRKKPATIDSAIIVLLSLLVAAWGPTRGSAAEVVFQQIYQFASSAPYPCSPAARLVEGADGFFYGTTSRGGYNDFGSVFKVTSTGSMITLLSFSGTNGYYPHGGLVLGKDGNFYGTTAGNAAGTNHGTVFMMSPAGALNTIHRFLGTNGSSPKARLEQGIDGNFYGTTERGGLLGLGTCFVISSNGALTTLVSFTGTNGANPYGGLAAGENGIFYGTTAFGGSNFTGDFTGKGTVFSITTNGILTTLVNFDGPNGNRPQATLAQGSDGKYYGTTSYGGANNSGTVFKLTPEGILTTLVHFGPAGGVFPLGGVTQGAEGEWYGTTGYRFVNSNLTNGTIFKLTTNGLLTTVVDLNGTNGLHPFTDMVRASDGNLYGTMADATGNRSVNGGTLFRLLQKPVITTIASSNGHTTISWSSYSNGTYRVERALSMPANDWAPLFPYIWASGSRSSFTDSIAGPNPSFFRVVLLP